MCCFCPRWLASVGASLPEAKKLARHASVQMTMKYAHIGIEDQAKALAALPFPAADNWQGIGKKPGVFDGQQPSPAGTEKHNNKPRQKRKNPCKSKGFDASSQSVSPDDADGPKVEAAGIEPASRDISMKASTCVADCLGLARLVAYQQGYYSSQLGAFFSSLRA